MGSSSSAAALSAGCSVTASAGLSALSAPAPSSAAASASSEKATRTGISVPSSVSMVETICLKRSCACRISSPWAWMVSLSPAFSALSASMAASLSAMALFSSSIFPFRMDSFAFDAARSIRNWFSCSCNCPACSSREAISPLSLEISFFAFSRFSLPWFTRFCSSRTFAFMSSRLRLRSSMAPCFWLMASSCAAAWLARASRAALQSASSAFAFSSRMFLSWSSARAPSRAPFREATSWRRLRTVARTPSTFCERRLMFSRFILTP